MNRNNLIFALAVWLGSLAISLTVAAWQPKAPMPIVEAGYVHVGHFQAAYPFAWRIAEIQRDRAVLRHGEQGQSSIELTSGVMEKGITPKGTLRFDRTVLAEETVPTGGTLYWHQVPDGQGTVLEGFFIWSKYFLKFEARCVTARDYWERRAEIRWIIASFRGAI